MTTATAPKPLKTLTVGETVKIEVITNPEWSPTEPEAENRYLVTLYRDGAEEDVDGYDTRAEALEGARDMAEREQDDQDANLEQAYDDVAGTIEDVADGASKAALELALAVVRRGEAKGLIDALAAAGLI